MTRARIEAAGAYAPRLRIAAEEVRDALGTFAAAGVERAAVPDVDEDALTMGYEAATRALAAADRDGDEIGYLALGTTTPPMAEEELLPRLAGMLDAPRSATTRTVTGSTRAGVQALADGVDAVPEGGVGLVIASDAPRGAPESAVEHAAGAGAAAFVLGNDGARVVDRAEHAEPYPGTRFREAGSDETTGLGITEYDRDAYRTTLSAAVEALDVDAGDVDAAALQSPDGKLPYRIAGALGVDAERAKRCSTVERLGDAGAASAPLGLVRALDEAEAGEDDGVERVLVGGFGSGAGATALLVAVDRAVPTTYSLGGEIELSYAEYLRRRGTLSSGPPEGGGAYVSVPNWRRTIPQRHRLEAGRCPDCGALAFPPEGACTDCGTPVEYETARLPGTGEIEAATTIERGGAPPEFAEQQSRSGPYHSAVVALDGPAGGSVSVPAQVLAPDDRTPAIGDRVEATIRRLYEQEGVIRYGFKMRLLDGE